MTAFDYGFLGLLLLSVLVGIWRGFVSEVFALIGWVIAFVVAKSFADELMPVTAKWVTTAWMQWALAFLCIFIAVLIVLALLRFLLRQLLSAAGLSPLDRFLGAGFGAVRAILVALIVVAGAGLTTVPREPWWRDSTFAPPLETVVIAAKPWFPKDLAARIKYR